MRTWKRLWGLSGRDRNAAIEAACVIAASRLGLRVIGYRRWKCLLSRLSLRNLSASAIHEIKHPDDGGADRSARLVAAVARNLFFHPTCLERSFGLWWVLRLSGFDADLRIGGRKTEEQFEAHAWVEYAGTPLNEPDDEVNRFSVFGDAGAVARELR